MCRVYLSSEVLGYSRPCRRRLGDGALVPRKGVCWRASSRPEFPWIFAPVIHLMQWWTWFRMGLTVYLLAVPCYHCGQLVHVLLRTTEGHEMGYGAEEI